MRRTGAVCCCLMILGAACGADTGVRASRERVVIGIAGALSGPGSDFSAGILAGVRVAVSEYNGSRDTSFAAEIAQADSQGTPEGAVRAAELLAGTERIVGAVGPFSVDEIKGAGPVFAGGGLPFVIPSVTSSDLSEAGWPGFRRLIASDRRIGSAMAAEALERRSARIVILSSPGAGFAEVAGGAKAALEGAGSSAARSDSLDPNADPGAAAAAVLRDAADAVLFAGPADRAGALAGALRARDFGGRFIAAGVAEETAFAETAAGTAEGTLAVSPWADPTDRRLEEFSWRYQDLHQVTPPRFAVEAYEGALMFLEAVEEVEPRPQAVVAFFHRARIFNGDSKRYQFDERGELVAPPLWVHEFRQSRWQLVGRSTRDFLQTPDGGAG